MKALVSLFVFACVCNLMAESYPDGPQVGEPARPLKITTWLQGPTKAAEGWPSNEVIVLEFWATWCGPCVGAIPHLNELTDEFKGKPVQFMALTAQDEKDVRRFLKKAPIHAWVGLSPDAEFGEDKPYRIYAIPHTVIIDLHGRIAEVTDPRSLTAELINLCLADKPLPQANEPGGEYVPGVVPGQYRLGGGKPLFQVLIRPASMTNQVDTWSGSALTLQPGQLKQAITHLFDLQSSRIVQEAPLPGGWYDFYISVPWTNGEPQGKAMLQSVFTQAVAAAFGLNVKKETREMDVFVLGTNAGSTAKLSQSTDRGRSAIWGWGEVTGKDETLDFFARALEHAVHKPVLNETGLTNKYSYSVTWNQTNATPNPEGMAAAVKDFGLDLIQTNRPLEVVVVSKRRGDD